jgi:hypothetical protein
MEGARPALVDGRECAADVLDVWIAFCELDPLTPEIRHVFPLAVQRTKQTNLTVGAPNGSAAVICKNIIAVYFNQCAAIRTLLARYRLLTASGDSQHYHADESN